MIVLQFVYLPGSPAGASLIFGRPASMSVSQTYAPVLGALKKKLLYEVSVAPRLMFREVIVK